MTELAAAYINEIAEGRIPSEDSLEAKAYKEWSGQDQKVTGTWAEFKFLEIQSKVRQGA